MRKPFFAIAILFLAGCSIDMEEMHPTVEHVFLQEEASIGGIVCTLEGSYPHIKNLDSVQVEININAAMDTFAMQTKDAIRNCPAYLAELTENAAEAKDSSVVSFDVKRLDDAIFSVVLLTSQMFEGAAHPNNTIDTFVFDLSEGQPLNLVTYLRDTTSYEEILESYVVRAMEKDGMDIENALLNPIGKFYLTEQELVLVDLFDVHALKAFEVRIPLTEFFPEESE